MATIDAPTESHNVGDDLSEGELVANTPVDHLVSEVVGKLYTLRHWQEHRRISESGTGVQTGIKRMFIKCSACGYLCAGNSNAEREQEWSTHMAEVKHTGRLLLQAQVLLREAQEILAGKIEATQVAERTVRLVQRIDRSISSTRRAGSSGVRILEEVREAVSGTLGSAKDTMEAMASDHDATEQCAAESDTPGDASLADEALAPARAHTNDRTKSAYEPPERHHDSDKLEVSEFSKELGYSELRYKRLLSSLVAFHGARTEQGASIAAASSTFRTQISALLDEVAKCGQRNESEMRKPGLCAQFENLRENIVALQDYVADGASVPSELCAAPVRNGAPSSGALSTASDLLTRAGCSITSSTSSLSHDHATPPLASTASPAIPLQGASFPATVSAPPTPASNDVASRKAAIGAAVTSYVTVMEAHDPAYHARGHLELPLLVPAGGSICDARRNALGVKAVLALVLSFDAIPAGSVFYSAIEHVFHCACPEPQLSSPMDVFLRQWMEMLPLRVPGEHAFFLSSTVTASYFNHCALHLLLEKFWPRVPPGIRCYLQQALPAHSHRLSGLHPVFAAFWQFILEDLRTTQAEPCALVTKPELIAFALRAHPNGILDDGVVIRSPVTGLATGIISHSCTGHRPHDSKQIRCGSCYLLHHKLQKQYSRSPITPSPAAPEASSPPVDNTLQEALQRVLSVLEHDLNLQDGNITATAELLCSFIRVLEQQRLPSGSHLHERLQLELKALNLDDMRGMRYPDYFLAFYQCAVFASGWKGVAFQRGPVNEGIGARCGHLPVDPTRIRGVIPGRSTLQSHTPLTVIYPSLSADIARLRDILSSRSDAHRLEGGISMDGIRIRAGLTHLEWTQVIIGCESVEVGGVGAIPVREAQQWSPEKLLPKIGRQVQQLFFTTTDGELTLPLTYVVQKGDKGSALFRVVKALVQELDNAGITVHWTSSDGFTSVDDYLARLKCFAASRPAPLVHVFDYTHLLKNMRNHLLNKGFCRNGVTFAMADLLELRTVLAASDDPLDKELRARLTNSLLAPSDKMAWAPVKDLFQLTEPLRRAACSKYLSSHGGLPDRILCFAEYVEHMTCIYRSFSFSESGQSTWQVRIQRMREALAYFVTARDTQYALSDACDTHLETTLVSLEQLWVFFKQRNSTISDYPVWSHISTLVVENFFSIIRSKHRYPSLLDFAVTYRAAFNYMVFSRCDETRATHFKSNFGKAYGNVKGITFNLRRDYYFGKPSEKETACAIAKHRNTAQLTPGEECADAQAALTLRREADIEHTRELVMKLRPTSGTLSLRDTCKVSEDTPHETLLKCPHCPKIFKGRKWLSNHVANKHGDSVPSTALSLTVQPPTAPSPTALPHTAPPHTAPSPTQYAARSPPVLFAPPLPVAAPRISQFPKGLKDSADHPQLVWLDFETTGLKQPRPWQLSATNGVTVFDSLIRVTTGWEPEAQRMFEHPTNGPKRSVKEAKFYPKPEAVAQQFLDWVRSMPAGPKYFFAFNAPFDMRVLHDFLAVVGVTLSPEWRGVDVRDLVRIWGLKGKLETLCTQRGISVQGAHDASCDVIMTIELMWTLVRDRPDSELNISELWDKIARILQHAEPFKGSSAVRTKDLHFPNVTPDVLDFGRARKRMAEAGQSLAKRMKQTSLRTVLTRRAAQPPVAPAAAVRRPKRSCGVPERYCDDIDADTIVAHKQLRTDGDGPNDA